MAVAEVRDLYEKFPFGQYESVRACITYGLVLALLTHEQYVEFIHQHPLDVQALDACVDTGLAQVNFLGSSGRSCVSPLIKYG